MRPHGGVTTPCGRRYAAWCKELEEAPLPVSEEKATGNVATLARGGVKAATVKFHLAGLRQAQIRAGLPPPEWGKMARLAQTRRGLERWEAANGAGKLERHPVKWHHMRALHEEWGSMGEKGRMLWAAACLCFFACLRAGEALAPEQEAFDEGAHLTWSDVEVGERNGKEVIRIKIKQSKTDRLRKGAFVVLESTEGDICPVRAVLRFMIDRRAGPGPFFSGSEMGGLTRREFVKEVKEALERKGISSEGISGHSFRIGAATAAAAGGASDEEVKALGRWRSREYKGYIRRDVTEQTGAARRLVEGARAEGVRNE